MRTRQESQSKRPGRPKRRRSSSPATGTAEEASVTTSSPPPLPSNSQSHVEAVAGADGKAAEAAVPQRKRQDRRKRDQRSAVEVVHERSFVELVGDDADENGGEVVANGGLDSSQQTSSSSKKVRFSGNGVDEQSSIGEVGQAVVTPTEVTPHMKRTTLEQSTAAAQHGQTARNSVTAQSTPAVMSSSPSGPFQQVQFSPLRDVLNGRMRRRLRRSHLSEVQNEIEEHRKEDVRRDHELERLRRSSEAKDRQLKQLMLELELQKQMGIEIAEEDEDDKEENAKHVQKKQDEIVKIKDEIAELRSRVEAAHGPGNVTVNVNSDDVNMDLDIEDNTPDNSGLVLVEPSDIDIPHEIMSVQREQMRLSGTPKTPVASDFYTNDTSISMIDIPDPAHEAERKEFEKALTNLSRKLSDAQSTLQIISIELQTLGFAHENASPEAIMSAIRNAFQQARHEMHEFLPGQVSLDASNGDFLRVLVSEIRRLTEEIRDLSSQSEQSKELEKLLRAQIGGVLNKLAEVDARNHTLELQWSDLDKESERKEKELIELNSQVENLEEESQEQTLELSQKDGKIKELEEVLGESSSSIEQLQYAIQSYCDEVATLEAQNKEMDAEYKEQISEMRNDYTKKHTEMQNALESETSRREMAETDNMEKTTEITELKVKLKDTANDLDSLRVELQSTQDLMESEKSRADTAEADLAEKNAIIATLEEKIQTAEATLSELQEDLRTLENMVTAERRQREEAEGLVDERGNELDSLEQRLTEAGTIANELRQKLFEVQQQREKEAAESTERQTELSLALDSEREHALEAEKVLFETKNEKLTVETKYANEVGVLNDKLLASQAEILNAHEEVEMLKNSIEAMTSEFEKEKSEQEKQSTIRLEYIQQLQNEIDEQKEKIAEVVEAAAEETLAHENALEQRNAVEVELDKKISKQRQKIEDLESAKHGLETRIESEAEELLNTQAKHADEVDRLRKALAERQNVLNSTVAERTELQSLLERTTQSKDTEILALRENLQAREDKVNTLSAQNNSLRRILAGRVANEEYLLQRIVEDAQAFSGEVQKSRATFMADGSRILQEVEADIEAQVEADAVKGGVVEGDNTSVMGEEQRQFRSMMTPSSMTASTDGKERDQQVRVASVAASTRKTTVSKRRTRKREFDSGIGLAAEEQIDVEVEDVERLAEVVET